MINRVAQLNMKESIWHFFIRTYFSYDISFLRGFVRIFLHSSNIVNVHHARLKISIAKNENIDHSSQNIGLVDAYIYNISKRMIIYILLKNFIIS